MPNSNKGNQSNNHGGRGQESGKPEKGLASTNEETKKESTKKAAETSKGGGRGKSESGR